MRNSLPFLFILVFGKIFGQSSDIPLNSSAYSILDRWDVTTGQSLFTTVKPISRKQFALAAQEVRSNSTIDKFDRNWLLNETREYSDSTRNEQTPLLKYFYRYPGDLFAHSEQDFDLHLNPIIVLGYGRDNQSGEPLFENYRGVEIRGTIDNKVSFYSLLTENQARYPYYVQQITDSTIAVPYEGFWKQYKDTGVDFLRVQSYIDFNITKHIGAQFGFGKHFIGDGQRSLILSDVGNNYPYLRLSTQIWRIKYTNIFAKLTAETRGGDFGLLGVGSFPKKYLANHHLSVQVTPNLTLGLFESVISGDSTNSGMAVEYLNPIIFYKAVEQQDGSSDNTIIGLDFKWNIWQTASLYGQLVIDELIVSELFANNGWWGNKQGIQIGAKYFNAFSIPNLDAVLEYNRVRPYLYSHESNYLSYNHYNMALAHPLGANFEEVLFGLTYRPLPRLEVQTDVLLAKYGNDLNNVNYGRDILKSYNERPDDYGINLLQGEQVNLTMIQTNLSYQLMHNTFIDVTAVFRKEKANSSQETATIWTTTFRWNFPNRKRLF